MQSGYIELQNGTRALIKRALVNVAASQTDASLVSAVSGKSIRVLAFIMVAGDTPTGLTFNTKPGGAGTAISCLLANAANGGAVPPFTEHGWFETKPGEGLSVTTGAGSATGLQVLYAEV
jgi:hypothetical protein